MLLLLFYCGNDRYACPCDYVQEIIPHVTLKKIHNPPAHVIGLLNAGGVLIPVVDWCDLIEGRFSQPSFHSRIIILQHVNPKGEIVQMGLLAERVIQTVTFELSDFTESATKLMRSAYLGGIVNDEKGIIQLVLVDQLFLAVGAEIFAGNV